MALRPTWFFDSAIIAAARQFASVDDPIVDPVLTSSSDAQYEALVSGACDFAVTAMDNVIGWNSRSDGGDFAIVAQTERTTPLYVVGRTGIRSLANLRNANLLVDSTENGFVIALRALLFDAGIVSDYQLTPAGGVRERFEALVGGSGDATLLGPPFDRLAPQAGLVTLACVQDSYPRFPGQGLVVRRSGFARKEEEFRRFLSLLDETLDLMRANELRARSLLAAAGYPAPQIDLFLSLMPDSLAPDKDGVALLRQMREMLGLPAAQAHPDMIVAWDMMTARID